MSTHQFKPGDVIRGTRATGVGHVEDGVYIRTDASLPWTGSDNCSYHEREIHDIRPLVVIDPEDREQVERFVRKCPADWCFEQDEETVREVVQLMQAALREFANPTPPKPDEPQRDGAVVECDYDGKHGRAVLLGGSWTFYGEALRDHSALYDDFHNVAVLSEGVVA